MFTSVSRIAPKSTLGLLVESDDAESGALFRSAECGVDNDGPPGRVEVDIGARSRLAHRGRRSAVQLRKLVDDVLLGGADDGVGAHGQGLLQP
jgi:hypothetical protein